jgi:SAM-dependent methyltransferase
MELADLQKNWNQFGRIDPLWAILTCPEKINKQWDLSDFFKTGTDEIDRILRHIEFLNVPLRRGRALDFGCGVGRLTQALCPYFQKCCGIDIALSMIKRARKYNRFGDKCEYYLNETERLPAFATASFDFIYSSLVLQHMEPNYAKQYIKEFLRILSPGGILVFQLPAELRTVQPLVGGHDIILPDSAFSAGIKPHRRRLTRRPGFQIDVEATVTNLSSFTWPSSSRSPNYPIALGNHWLNDAGELLVMDDARATLERELKPMEEIDLRLQVTAPEKPGNYILQLDMVQEFIAWFGQKGSQVTEISVRINGVPGMSSPEVPRGLPEITPVANFACRTRQTRGSPPMKMEMYGVPKSEIAETIASAGGELVDAQQDASAGADWTSFCYFATKPTEAGVGNASQ